jgi:dihydropteroate synthase
MSNRYTRPSVMGIVNVTPDSFSDGGVHLDPDAAAAAARRMIEEGAAIVDVGGESTRPGHEPVSLDEELRRVVPVLERLAGVPVSIDTSKAEVARRALELGAELVNDVTALRGDAGMAELVAATGAWLCLMHWQREPDYEDVVRGRSRVPRGASPLRRRGGRRRGSRRPRSRDRVRQDRAAELRARPASPRARRARPSRARRLLAQELARAHPRRRECEDGPRCRRAWRRQSPRTTAARRSCAVHDVRAHVEALTVAAAVSG